MKPHHYMMIVTALWILCGCIEAHANPVVSIGLDGNARVFEFTETLAPPATELMIADMTGIAYACDWAGTPDNAVMCRPN